MHSRYPPFIHSKSCHLDSSHVPDISALQVEVSAMEELARQLFVEYVDMHEVKVGGHITVEWRHTPIHVYLWNERFFSSTSGKDLLLKNTQG